MLVRIRDQSWIIGARRLCKQVRRKCLACRHLDAAPGQQQEASLPKVCVNQAPAFSVSGLDHGGPLFCSDFGSEKYYVLLITCAVVRAIHLELVDSLSAQVTLAALRQFVARRGLPFVIMSDNAQGFVAAKDLVLKYYGSDGPDW